MYKACKMAIQFAGRLCSLLFRSRILPKCRVATKSWQAAVVSNKEDASNPVYLDYLDINTSL
jgi:hypothetical protein